MKLLKDSFIRICQHHFTGFNTHKEFLRTAINKAGDQLNIHEIESFKVSLNNMKEQIEAYISCKQPASSKPLTTSVTRMMPVYLTNKEGFYFHIKVSEFSFNV
jgi:hypothetical protein